MPDGGLTALVVDLTNKVNDIRTDVAVIKVQTNPIADHEQRLRSLEASRARIWSWWAAAAVIGTVAGWLLGSWVHLK